MTVRWVSCVFLVIALESTPSDACPGIFLPPFKLDLGQTWSESGTRAASGSQLLLGLSRATLDPRPVDFDIGLGYVRWRAGDDTSPIAARSTSAPTIPDARGAYLDVAARIHGSGNFRSWLGVRGELLSAGGAPAFGVAARVSTELWTGATKGADGVLTFGTLAIGVYAEAGLREGRDDVRTFTVGITMRSPFVAVSGGPRPSPRLQHEMSRASQ